MLWDLAQSPTIQLTHRSDTDASTKDSLTRQQNWVILPRDLYSDTHNGGFTSLYIGFRFSTLILNQFTWFHHLGSKLVQTHWHHIPEHNIDTNEEVTSQWPPPLLLHHAIILVLILLLNSIVLVQESLLFQKIIAWWHWDRASSVLLPHSHGHTS